jgi:molybdenum cofactor cytidylyltransferase
VTTEGGLEAVVLAAGAGTRFGGAKLSRNWRGRPLIEYALATAFEAPVRSVWVVTGADPGVAWAARTFATRRGMVSRLNLVHAIHHAEGMAASLRAGLASLPADARGAFVLLGDMPAIPPDVAPRLADALRGEIAACAPVCGGRRGHPVLFARSLFSALSALTGDEGARGVLETLGSRLALVETEDEGILRDVDRPDEIRAAGGDDPA